jgi:hypothetical protein
MMTNEHEREILRQFIKRETEPLLDRIEKLEGLLTRTAVALRGIDQDYPEWGLRSRAEECEQAITRPLRHSESK